MTYRHDRLTSKKTEEEKTIPVFYLALGPAFGPRVNEDSEKPRQTMGNQGIRAKKTRGQQHRNITFTHNRDFNTKNQTQNKKTK